MGGSLCASTRWNDRALDARSLLCMCYSQAWPRPLELRDGLGQLFLVPSRSARAIPTRRRGAGRVRRHFGMGARGPVGCRHCFPATGATDEAESETPGAYDQTKDCFHISIFYGHRKRRSSCASFSGKLAGHQ